MPSLEALGVRNLHKTNPTCTENWDFSANIAHTERFIDYIYLQHWLDIHQNVAFFYFIDYNS